MHLPDGQKHFSNRAAPSPRRTSVLSPALYLSDPAVPVNGSARSVSCSRSSSPWTVTILCGARRTRPATSTSSLHPGAPLHPGRWFADKKPDIRPVVALLRRSHGGNLDLLHELAARRHRLHPGDRPCDAGSTCDCRVPEQCIAGSSRASACSGHCPHQTAIHTLRFVHDQDRTSDALNQIDRLLHRRSSRCPCKGC